MTELVKDTNAMIKGMSPELQDGEFVFCETADPVIIARAIPLATMWEGEELSLLLPVDQARKLGFAVDLPMRQITLQVYSSLEGIGLTAAVSACLTKHKIPCNIIAATHHDHVFVPSTDANRALRALLDLQNSD